MCRDGSQQHAPVTTIKRKGHCHELLPLSAPLSYFSPEKRIFRSFPSTVSHPTTGNQPVTSDQPTIDEKTSTISQPAIYPHQPLSQAQISPLVPANQPASQPRQPPTFGPSPVAWLPTAAAGCGGAAGCHIPPLPPPAQGPKTKHMHTDNILCWYLCLYLDPGVYVCIDR